MCTTPQNNLNNMGLRNKLPHDGAIDCPMTAPWLPHVGQSKLRGAAMGQAPWGSSSGETSYFIEIFNNIYSKNIFVKPL